MDVRELREWWLRIGGAALAGVLVVATLSGWSGWTIPLQILGWTALMVAIARRRRAGESAGAMLRGMFQPFERPVSRLEIAFACVLAAGVVVALGLGIFVRYG